MKHYQKGVTLIELLVALVLGLVLLTGIGHLFLATNRTLTLQDELSRIQENARLAIDLMTTDIRSAGFTGCPAQGKVANNLQAVDDSREWMAHFDKGILGLSSGSETTSQIDASAISEAIVIHSIHFEEGITVSNHNPTTATATLVSNLPSAQDEGDLFAFISDDCDQVSVFRGGAGTENNTVTHPASSGNLTNCTSHLEGHYNCHTSAASAQSMNHTGSLLAPLYSYAYYIRNSNNVPSLYRKEAGEYSSGNAKNAEALVEGIENINILYGIDSDNDGVANQYHSADTLQPDSNEWNRVTSIKLELLARSLNEVAPEPQSYFFAGELIEPEDNFIRRNFITTIQLRNRI